MRFSDELLFGKIGLRPWRRCVTSLKNFSIDPHGLLKTRSCKMLFSSFDHLISLKIHLCATKFNAVLISAGMFFLSGRTDVGNHEGGAGRIESVNLTYSFVLLAPRGSFIAHVARLTPVTIEVAYGANGSVGRGESQEDSDGETEDDRRLEHGTTVSTKCGFEGEMRSDSVVAVATIEDEKVFYMYRYCS